jgi:hypothetical protein
MFWEPLEDIEAKRSSLQVQDSFVIALEPQVFTPGKGGIA